MNCPFCHHYERKTHQVEQGDNDYWTVVCLNCGAEGPLSVTEKGAQRLWAKRGSERHVYSIESGLNAECVCGTQERF